jgi:hypothetical protein
MNIKTMPCILHEFVYFGTPLTVPHARTDRRQVGVSKNCSILASCIIGEKDTCSISV